MGIGSNFEEKDPFRSLQILEELSKSGSMTQRDISSRLGLALGLVNSYIKNLISKGYITVRSIPPKRYTYFLTPKGFTEKTRLTYNLLHDYTKIYRDARRSFRELFTALESNGASKLVFAGADEVAEIAYLTLQEFGLGLSGIVDDEKTGTFFKNDIQSLDTIKGIKYDVVIITSYMKQKKLHKELLACGVSGDDIKNIFER